MSFAFDDNHDEEYFDLFDENYELNSILELSKPIID